MKTINDFLEALKQDSELNSVVLGCELLYQDYKPRNLRFRRFKPARTKTSIALDHFWDSLDGGKLRQILESKYSVNLSNTRLRGELKSAILLYLSGVVGK